MCGVFYVCARILTMTVKERGRWSPPVEAVVFYYDHGRGGCGAGEFEYAVFNPRKMGGREGFAFRFLRRGECPKLGLVRPDGSWMCLEMLETDEVLATQMAGKKGISVTLTEEGVVGARAVVGLPDWRVHAISDLVFEVDAMGQMYSFIRLTFPDGAVHQIEDAEHIFEKKNNFIVVSSEVDRATGREVLTTYVRQKEIDENPQMFIYHAGIERCPNNVFKLWTTRNGESLSWRLSWQIEWKNEFLQQLTEVDVGDFAPALDQLVRRLGRLGTDRPIDQRSKGTKPLSVSR